MTTIFLLLRIAAIKQAHRGITLLLVIPFFALTFELWVVRPQIFTYVMTAFLLFILESWRQTQKRWIFVLLPFIMLVWANMHAGVVLGMGIVVLYVANHLINSANSVRRSLVFIGVSVLALGAVVVNPNGVDLLKYSAIIAPGVEKLQIAEWKSFLHYLQSWQSSFFLLQMIAVIIVYALVVVATSKKGEWRQTLIDGALIATGFIMPFVSIRHVGIFSLLTFAVTARALTLWLKPTMELVQISPVRFKIGVFVIACVALASSTFFAANRPELNAKVLPVGAANFIRDHHVSGPIFNELSQGGYLIWRLYSQEKVFMDGRTEVYLGKPIDDYLVMSQATEGSKELFDETYKINTIVIGYRGALAPSAQQIFQHTVRDLGFRFVYWDDASLILVRQTDENKKLIEQYGYSLINPFGYLRNPTESELARMKDEIARARMYAPDSQAIAAYRNVIR